jgi:hypothetical protein
VHRRRENALPSGDSPAISNPVAPVAASRPPSAERLVRMSSSPTNANVTSAFDGVRKNQTTLDTK